MLTSLNSDRTQEKEAKSNKSVPLDTTVKHIVSQIRGTVGKLGS